MRGEAKRGGIKKSGIKRKISEKLLKPSQPEESLENLLRQKEEIEALLSSLEDAYGEASILEEDYNDIKYKNEKKLGEINRKIDILAKKQAGVKAKPEIIPKPGIEVPVIEEIEEEFAPLAAPVLEEKPKKERKEKIITSISQDDLKKLELDLAEKIKEMVEGIGAKVTEKDLAEMRNNFAKFEAEIDKMKALIETVREGRRIEDEKIQRVVEGLAEIRTMVYGKEASMREQEIRLEKVTDVLGKLEPEKIMMELGRRDKEMGNQTLRINKLEETTKEFGDMLKEIEMLLRNIGSLEHVINISNEASEKLMGMENIQRNNQKMLDKIQGIYAELSKRMEEFMLYRAKQDRMDDLMNDVLKNLDDLSTKAAYFVTKDDLESLRTSIQSGTPAESSEYSELKSQKEEIEMLLKTIEDEFKSRTISKEEYEKMKNANLAELKKIESRMGAGGAFAVVPPEEKPKVPKMGEKTKEEKVGKETKSETLLRDLEDTFRKGFINKEAYEKTRKMILGKR